MHYSKKDTWLGIVLFGAMGYSIVSALIELGLSYHSMLLVVVFAFICWVWFGTYYKIEGMTLIVRCGPFVKQFDINKIEQVRDTHNPLSAPALSIDRLELRGQGVYILISPEDKSAFVKDLKEINDRIVYLS